VRLNQPFGDVAQWDLLPEAAIAGLALVPGSNPLYGLNTLGGALVLTTKSGLTHAGTEFDAGFGSAGRRRVEVGQGGHWAGGWHAYVAASALDERGWRERSAGSLGNLFLKAGRQEGDDGWSVTLLDAGSHLAGNGLLNESLASIDRSAAYTTPDTSRNHDTLVSLQATRGLEAGSRVAVQAWYRHGRRQGRTGDIRDADPSAARFQATDATINTSRSQSSEAGAGGQWSAHQGPHQLVLGADAAMARVSHDQVSQDALFDSSRHAVPLAPGEGTQDVALRARTVRLGLFAGDTIALPPDLQLNVSARWDGSYLRNDLGQPAPLVHESFHYAKLNPALGLTHAVSDAVTAFASVSQGTRVPTVLELGCADAARPCVLPTGLQSDPYLKQVVARTLEVGARVRPHADLQLSGAVFRTTDRDDIVFLRSSASPAGYFANVDRTRRQGLELAASGRTRNVEWQAGYTRLDATYQSDLVLPGPLSTALQPNAVRRGSPIAGLPRQVLKLSADWRVLSRWTLGADWQAVGSQAVAGDEGGGRAELGRLAGFSVLHARLRWRITERWEAYLRVHNLLDRHYATYAAGNLDLFPRGVALQPGADPAAARFIAPAAPRLVLAGVRYEWD
jgi:outer membrane receptor protein involved in Fe transport